MSLAAADEAVGLPVEASFESRGTGPAIVMVHGLAASLHDWDFLIPDLVRAGYAGYALDLLGHGASPKPSRRDYKMAWLFDHFDRWLDSLKRSDPFVIVGHSLGGYLALDYARRYADRVRGLVLISPVFSATQLSPGLRLTHRLPVVSGWLSQHTPIWFFRLLIDASSISAGHGLGGMYELPKQVRAQTALDYRRTAPGAYNLLRDSLDLVPDLPNIATPALVLWGEQDRALDPKSFASLVRLLPNATGSSTQTGHVPHQSRPRWLNGLVLQFIESLPA
jgi:pimeloyl-ACP methyl ester carboxylesterase